MAFSLLVRLGAARSEGVLSDIPGNLFPLRLCCALLVSRVCCAAGWVVRRRGVGCALVLGRLCAAAG